MSTKKRPEQIVDELHQSPHVYLNYWSDHDDNDELLDEPKIIMDGAFTLEQLRAIVTVREKQLGLPDPRREAAMQCVRLLREACQFEMWEEQGNGVAEQIKHEFGITKGTQK